MSAATPPPPLPDFEGPPFHEAMRDLHAWKQPGLYLEISAGPSQVLHHARCPAMLLETGQPDPNARPPDVQQRLVAVLNGPVERFLPDDRTDTILPGPIDLAFLNGRHLSEVLLREFAAVAQRARPDAVIVLHNTLPVEPAIAERRPNPEAIQAPHRHNWWAGDVWRLALYLKRRRPDLVMAALPCPPTGLVCITRLDPQRRMTEADLRAAAAEMQGYDLAAMGVAAFLAEMGVVPPQALRNPGWPGRLLAPAIKPAPHIASRANPAQTDRLVSLLQALPPHGLQTATLTDARVQAFQGSFDGGLVLGPEHDALRHLRSWRPVDSFDPERVPQDRLAGDYIYGGNCHPHFGHFMAEYVHRILPSQQSFGPGRFLFAVQRGQATQFAQLPAWMRGAFAFVGLGAEHVRIVSADTQVETLHVCQQGGCLGGQPDSSYLDLLKPFMAARLADHAGAFPTHPRVYVSRSAMDTGVFLGERYIEELLRQRGFHILHPQQMPFAAQVWTYGNAEELIFCEGSACHGCELFGRASLKRVLMIGKREIGTFTRVLQDRCETFFAQSGHHAVGSLARHRGTDLLAYMGVHLLNVPLFLADLRDRGFADLEPIFDRKVYARTVEEDLCRYISQQMAAPPERRASPAELEGFIARFNSITVI